MRSMHILWNYLRPHWRLAALALLLAGLAQVLNLVDPIIFGMIIVLTVLYMPRGIGGLIDRYLTTRRFVALRKAKANAA